MQSIRNHLARKQQDFAHHAFFRWLETADDRRDVAAALSQLAFWVASVQDVLAINESKLADPRLRDIARAHRTADAGHDKWFFHDLHRLGLTTPSAQELFTKPRAPIRRATFELMSEVFRATTDVARVTLLLALEAANTIFFEATADWGERACALHDLKFFSRFHVEIARHNELFELELELDDATTSACIGVVDRTFAAFALMFDTLVATEHVQLVACA